MDGPLPGLTRRREGLGAKERAVGGEGQVLEAGGFAKEGDELGEVAADERFASGEADLLDAVFDEDAGKAADLLVGQKFGSLEELVFGAEDLARHAVGAAEVAPVGDRDAEIAKRAAEGINEGHGTSLADWRGVYLR